MIPISRVEMYLAKICGEDVELPIPQTRKEVFLAIIAGEDYEKPVPSSRVELYLAKILGDDVPLPLPQSREEIFLAKIAGVEYPLPYPESRIEYWLHKWATYEEWETISGNPVSFTSLAAPLRKLSIAFSPVQTGSGDPSPDNVRPISGWSSLTVYHSGADTSDPQTISISLGSTVYSGWVDAVTGVGEVTMASSDLGFFNWQSSSASVGRAVETTTAPAKTGVPSSVIANILCSAYKTDANDNIARGITGICVNRFGYIKIQDASFIGMTFAEIKEALTGAQVVYELATPIPIQLTPQEINSLAGDNVMWSNANQPITVEYRKN